MPGNRHRHHLPAAVATVASVLLFLLATLAPLDAEAACPPPGADADADGICDPDDNCPAVPNADQHNTDGLPDGGDACDAVDAALNLTKLRLKGDRGGPNPSGSVDARGDFLVDPADDHFSADAGVSLHVVDGMPVPTDVTWTWGAAECSVNGAGVVRCVDAQRRAKALFKPFRRVPSQYRFKVKVRGLTIEAPFAAPVGVTLTNDGVVDRFEATTECTPKPRALICREL